MAPDWQSVREQVAALVARWPPQELARRAMAVIIDGIPPISGDTPVYPLQDLPDPRRDPFRGFDLGRHVKYLHAIAREGVSPAFLATPDLATRLALHGGKVAARKLGKLQDRDDILASCQYLARLREQHPEDPEVPFLEYRCISQDDRGGDPEYTLLYAATLKDCIQLAGDRLRFEHYTALLGVLGGLARFHACYLLAMLLLTIVPGDIMPYRHAAFPAYQLGRPFRWFLHAINQHDPGLVLAMLESAWIGERLQSADSLRELRISAKMLQKVEESTKKASINSGSVSSGTSTR